MFSSEATALTKNAIEGFRWGKEFTVQQNAKTVYL